MRGSGGLLQSLDWVGSFFFLHSGALRPQKPYGLLGTGGVTHWVGFFFFFHCALCPQKPAQVIRDGWSSFELFRHLTTGRNSECLATFPLPLTSYKDKIVCTYCWESLLQICCILFTLENDVRPHQWIGIFIVILFKCIYFVRGPEEGWEERERTVFRPDVLMWFLRLTERYISGN